MGGEDRGEDATEQAASRSVLFAPAATGRT